MPVLYARFRHGDHEAYGLLEGERVRLVEGDIFADPRPSGAELPLDSIRPLAPVPRPGKILAAAVNYPSHVAESQKMTGKAEAPPQPELFLKPSSSVIGPGDPIVLPPESRRVDYEGELVAVIGRRCRNVSPEEALAHVFGYTCGNDVSARYWQRDDMQWWRAKGADTFCPVGPVIATGLNPADVALKTRLNGEEVQSASTSALIHSTAALISFASRSMTLEPGDLMFTGTPGQTGRLSHGDVVEVEVEGVGVLRNPVVEEGPRGRGGGPRPAGELTVRL